MDKQKDSKINSINASLLTKFIYYENGNLKHEWNFINGQLHGLHSAWYKNGDKWYERIYNNQSLIWY